MEILLGNTNEQKELRFRLNSFRLFHFKLLQEKYYHINFIPLSQFLLDNELQYKINIKLFKEGIEQFYKYQDELSNNYVFLPLDRVFVGLHYTSENSKNELNEFGGYYSMYQAYYHLEQISLTSLLGCYTDRNYNKELVTLELLRSYFHDSIHYNTFRSYKLKINYDKTNIRLDDVHRLQYGFNFRREDGVTFSNKDNIQAKSTRNLGIIMEGVTDDFSKIAIGRIVENNKIHFNDLSHFENIIFNEISSTSFNEVYISDTAFSPQEKLYLTRLNEAYDTTWKKYYEFLNEFANSTKQAFRDFIFANMIKGDHVVFKDYFDRMLNDIVGFEKLFKSPHY